VGQVVPKHAGETARCVKQVTAEMERMGEDATEAEHRSKTEQDLGETPEETSPPANFENREEG